LTSDRPYRPAWKAQKALDFLQEQAGTHFDPVIVPEFLAMVEAGELG
jgi:putative two-component system response regulator